MKKKKKNKSLVNQSKRMAVFVLQRNLPSATDELIEKIKPANDTICDFYVIESGSDEESLSKYCSFWAFWPEAKEKGLHYCRGMNYGLSELHKTGKKYEFYYMLMGDTKFVDDTPDFSKLIALFDEYSKLGILSSVSDSWGKDVKKNDFNLHFLIPHVAWAFRHEFLEKIIDKSEPQYMHYFYDGDNFRGYDADSELILKCYKHDYAFATTDRVKINEDHELMARNADKIKTERVKVHRKLMFDEGIAWLKTKYNCSNKFQFREMLRKEMSHFLNRNPQFRKFV